MLMKGKLFPLQNRGMSRDISASKAENTFAFENHNIRIEARNHDTLLSVTNERGNRVIGSLSFSGELIGYNVLNEYIILFTHGNDGDRIYRVTYKGGDNYSTMFKNNLLFVGNLGFSLDNAIESIVSYESPSIQKIYWVDGKNVMRFMNFVDDKYDTTVYGTKEMLDENGIDTTFNVNRGASFNIDVNISKNENGQNRPNGVVQYIVTYYNRNGIQTSYVYISDLIYLSPDGHGGSADGFNSNAVSIKLSNLDSSFDYVRVYSVVRTSYNGTPSAYIVGESAIVDRKSVEIVDNGTHLEAFDYTELLFLGSRPVVAGTITHKDGTLFLGDLKSIGNSGVDELEKAVKDNAFVQNTNGDNWQSAIVDFVLTNNEEENIPYNAPSGLYPYTNQLKFSSSQITTFKGGEKYRFALRFRKKDGTESDAMWIGDKVNHLYPMIDYSDKKGSVRRAVAVCNLPKAIIEKARKCGFYSVTLCMAKADYSDRAVMAQGVVSPTVFNNWSRYNDAPFLQSSWIFRPRKSNIANRHYSVLKKSNSPYGEIQSNWWEDTSPEPTPYYFLNKSTSEIANKVDGMDDFTKFKFVVRVVKEKNFAYLVTRWFGGIWISKYIGSDEDEDVNGTTNIDGKVQIISQYIGFKGHGDAGIEHVRTRINDILLDNQINQSIDADSMKAITDYINNNHRESVLYGGSGGIMGDKNTYEECLEAMSWTQVSPASKASAITYSRYTRNLYFVDEHAVTLNSPEIQYDRINIDNMKNLKFRIVGLAKITGNISDYSIDYSNGHRSGEHVNDVSFSKQNIERRPDGLLSWPLYFESSMFEKDNDHPNERHDDKLYDFTSNDYSLGSGIVTYMMNMWHHSGSIPECYDENQNGYSILDRKVFANLRYSYYSLYNNYMDGSWGDDVDIVSVRQFNAVDRQLMDIRYDSEVKVYSGTESQTITMPGFNKYPIFKTMNSPSADEDISLDHYLRSQSPVSVEYRSNPHALICFGNKSDGQIVLPKTAGMVGPDAVTGDNPSSSEDIETAGVVGVSDDVNGPFLPWSESAGSAGYPAIYLNSSNNYAFNATLSGNSAYIAYDADLVARLIESKESVGSNSFYMILNISGARKLVSANAVIDDSFTVDSFKANVLFVRQYINGGFTQVTPAITSVKLVVDGSEVSALNYTATVKCYRYGEWIDADSVEITNKDGNTACAFRVDVEYHHDVYGDVRFSTDSQIENITELSYGEDNTEDYNPDPEGEIRPFAIVNPDIDIDDNNREDGIGDETNPGDIEDGGSGSDGTENVDEGDTGNGNNRLKNTSYMFTVSKRSYSEFGRRIRIDCASVQAFDGSFSDSVKVVNVASGSKDMYELHEGVVRMLDDDEITLNFGVHAQDEFRLKREDAKYFGTDDEYLFIGELYYDYKSIDEDKRYGGITDNAIKSNVFIDCSKPYEISDSVVLNGNMGDTYFQRWDCVKTVPYSKNSVNGVVDIMSFMVETHINLDGRTDLNRGTTSLASIDYDQFGSLNQVYSQENNFIQSMDTDSSINEDSYETSVTWSLEKHDGQEIDPWTHMTLASVLSLDGDKGRCNALARFSNTIIAFQDRGICEIMFNSRTQLTTENGVPVEIANSGKVDGKRYISNKYGCTNKWSIAEGKSGLYFVDNISKIIGVFNGEGITPLSTRHMFDAWVRRNNSTAEWSPKNPNAFRTFYDKVHSDVYFINSMDNDNPCLVFNEMLDSFTSFFDYKAVPMMVNVCDRFISYKANRLYVQNEGGWCSIFGEQKPFWMTWKVQPEPYSDKIWTNIEYRADFFDNPGTEDVSLSDKYLPDVTFSKLVVENEYQRGEMDIQSGRYPSVEKKFRTWRLDIPRDMNSRYRIDRIRNPWVFVTLKKDNTKSNEMMSLSDIMAKYFSEE